MQLKVAEASRLQPRDRLIVALDISDASDARRLVEKLGESVVFYKIGMELAYGGGLPLVSELAAAGKQVFLDLKLHDIPNTVERATAQAAKLGARFLTVHAYPQTMRAAVAGAKGSGMQILAVTVLTSYDDADLSEAVYRFGVVETVRRRAEQALELGVDGLVASAAEAAMVRQTVGAKLVSRHARHSACGRGRWRPEARRDACRSHPQRRGLPGRWPPGYTSG